MPSDQENLEVTKTAKEMIAKKVHLLEIIVFKAISNQGFGSNKKREIKITLLKITILKSKIDLPIFLRTRVLYI